MTTPAPPSPTSGASEAVLRDWDAIRNAGDIQFAPLPPAPQAETPDWLRQLGELLAPVFQFLGRILGLSLSTIQWIAIALAALFAAYLLWRLAQRFWPRRGKAEGETSEWRPDQTAAIALLEDADRLAADGRFDEAAHLLLQRSVHHIASARPDWLHPSSTAREIARLEPLPAAARRAFAAIAERVERSRFALRPLAAPDWQAARAAYAEFALEKLA